MSVMFGIEVLAALQSLSGKSKIAKSEDSKIIRRDGKTR
jgi:hypothetical protein